MKLLLNKDNAGIIYSDEIARTLFPPGMYSNLKRSKSLKTTCNECEESIDRSLKPCKSERYRNNTTCRKSRQVSQHGTYERTRNTKCNMMFDGMPRYSMPPLSSWLNPWKFPEVQPCDMQAVKSCNVPEEQSCELPDLEPYEPAKTRPIKYSHIKPCKCGSIKSIEELEKMALSQMKLTPSEAKLIACICKSDICEKECDKILESLLMTKKAKAIKEAKERIRKEKEEIIKQKRRERIKARMHREKLKEKCDIARQILKKNLNERAYIQVMKEIECRKLSDRKLAVASVSDLGIICENAVSRYRCLLNNTDSDDGPCYSDEAMEIYESKARIRHRIRNMKIIKTIAQIRKGRYFRKKGRRGQPCEPGCNELYVQTLKKKPCLWVFDLCPNFYPKCISLLKLWRQFIHVLIFVLAFIVWTPCLLCLQVLNL